MSDCDDPAPTQRYDSSGSTNQAAAAPRVPSSQEGEPQQQQQNDFFDTTTNNSHRYQYLASQRFIFDGESEGVIVLSPSVTSSTINSSAVYEPLLPGYHISGGDGLPSISHLDEDHYSPLALPFDRLQQHRRRRHNELSLINYLNLFTIVIYGTISVLFGSGLVLHWLPSTWTVTTLPTYETLLTPSQWAGDYLWIPVLSCEALFCLVQFLPAFRARPEVVTGVTVFWFYIGMLQSMTTLLFCLKWIIPAWMTLALTAACLLLLQVHRLSQQQQSTTTLSTTRVSKWKYWIFTFPFELHLGWILPLLASRGSMIVRHYGRHDKGMQLCADMVAMALLLACAGAYLVQRNGPTDWVVPIMILWSYVGIGCRLLDTPDALVDLYGRDVVVAVRGAAWCFAGVVAMLLLPLIVVWVAREFCTIHVVQLNDDEEEDDNEEEAEGDDDNGLRDLLLPHQHGDIMSQI